MLWIKVHRSALDSRGSIVNQDVQPAVTLGYGLEQHAYLLQVAHLSLDPEAVHAQFKDGPLGIGRRLVAAHVVKRDIRAPPGEFKSDRSTNAPTGACDQGNLALEFAVAPIHRLLP